MRKAQFAMEYMLVVGFSLVIVIPVVSLLYQEYNNSRTEVHVEHMTELVREIAYQAEKLYYQGPPSKTLIKAYFPAGVEEFKVVKSPVAGGEVYSIEVVMADSSSSIYQDVPMVVNDNGNPAIEPTPGVYSHPFEGDHSIRLQVVDGGVNPNYVWICDESVPSSQPFTCDVP